MANLSELAKANANIETLMLQLARLEARLILARDDMNANHRERALAFIHDAGELNQNIRIRLLALYKTIETV